MATRAERADAKKAVAILLERFVVGEEFEISQDIPPVRVIRSGRKYVVVRCFIRDGSEVGREFRYSHATFRAMAKGYKRAGESAGSGFERDSGPVTTGWRKIK